MSDHGWISNGLQQTIEHKIPEPVDRADRIDHNGSPQSRCVHVWDRARLHAVCQNRGFDGGLAVHGLEQGTFSARSGDHAMGYAFDDDAV